jgi:hypothetical protein
VAPERGIFSYLEAAVLIRWEYYATNFVGFVQLAFINMLLKHF